MGQGDGREVMLGQVVVHLGQLVRVGVWVRVGAVRVEAHGRRGRGGVVL